MITLWLAFILMLLVACGILFIPVLKREVTVDSISRAEMNTQIYRQRLHELEADREADRITEADFQLIKKELDATLVQEVPKQEKSDKKAGKAKLLPGILFALLPAGALLYYALYSYDEKVEEWILLKAEMQTAIEKTLQQDPEAMAELRDYSMADFIRVLQQQLQYKGGDAQGWFLLGSSYLEVKLYEPANSALRKAYELDPTVPDHGIAYAQTLIALNNGRLDPDSERLLSGMVKDFPGHPGVKMVYGMAAFSSARYEIAISQWEALLAYGRSRTGNSNNAVAQEGEAVLMRSIALAKQKLAEQKRANAAGTAKSSGDSVEQKSVAKSSEEPSAAGIEVKVLLSQEVEAAITGSETLFVLAKAMQGPPMPLAAKKLALSEINWPLTVSLTDQDAMIEQMKLSSFAQVKVVARISNQGQPIAQSGDWFGEVENVSTKEVSRLQITIGQRVP